MCFKTNLLISISVVINTKHSRKTLCLIKTVTVGKIEHYSTATGTCQCKLNFETI